ncbi:MAG: hypothetical protein E7774_01215 [Bradyrhizobium sp.]|nr:MAG: hypothetical protein E7774_01215 [Bradyrhizobium sp.]
MAQKHPAKDAVSAAMSAIENALNLSGDGRNSEPTIEPPMSRTIPAKSLEPSEPAPSRRLPPPEDIKAPLVDDFPANDDRPAIGPIVQALQIRRASRAPVVAAAFGSLLWLALSMLYASAHFPWDATASTKFDYLTRPETVLLALSALGPMILFFGFAALARRLHELRLSARSITQVALRLAEPETVASENVATLSQAIRREIATMGDGIERALARAAELETLVRSEVSTLERAYSDNERRIRSLIAEMADQREAILSSGGRVRAVIDDAHRGIANDLESIAIRLSDRVSSVGGGVANSLSISAEAFAQAMDRASEDTVERIRAQAGQMRDTLSNVAGDVSARLAAASGHSAEEIISRVADIDQRIRGAGEALAADFAGRNQDLVSRIEASGNNTIDSLRRNANSIVAELTDATSLAGRAFDVHDGRIIARISESSAEAAEAIRLHGDAVATRLSVASDSLARDFGQRVDELVERVESSARGISDIVVAHTDGLATRLDEVADRLHESVVVRGQALQDSLTETNVRLETTLAGKTEEARSIFETVGAVWSEHFDARNTQLRGLIDDTSLRGQALQESLAEANTRLESTFVGKTEEARVMFETVGAAWSEHFDARHAQLRGLIDDSAGLVGSQIEDFARRAGESIATETVATQDRLDAAARTALERWTDQAREVGDRFAAVAADAVATITVGGDNLQEALSSSVASIEDALNSRGGGLVADLNNQARRIDDQLGALNGLIGEGGESVVERIAGHTARFGETLTGQIEAIDSLLLTRRSDLEGRLSEHHAHLNQRMEEQQTRFDESLTDHRARFEEASGARLAEFETAAAANQTIVELALSTHTRTIDDLLRDGVANVETTLIERGRDVVARIEAETKLLTSQLEGTLTTIEQTVIVRGGELDDRLSRRSLESVAIFDAGIEAADARASTKLDDVRSSIEAILQRIDGALAARAETIKETLARSTLEAAKTLGEGGREVAQGIIAKSTELEESLQARTVSLTQALSELASDINAKLADRLDDMSGALGGSVERFRNEVVNPLHVLSGQLESGGVEIATALARHAASLGETVETHVQRIGIESNSQLVARIEELRGLVEGPASDLVTRLTARGDEVAGQIASVSQRAAQTFDQQTADLMARSDALAGQIAAISQRGANNFEQQIANLVALMTRRGDDLLAAIGASASGSVRELGALSGQIGVAVETSTASLRAAAEAAHTQSAESIGALIQALTGEIDRSGASLREVVESNATASVTTFNAAGDRMRAELGQVLERLSQVGSVLDRMVGAAGTQLVAIEGGLTDRIEQLQTALQAMSTQVSSLDRISTETRSESGALVERLSSHTDALATVARDLAASQQSVDQTLQERHDSLQSLFAEITEKSHEFDAVARHFSASFEESFAKAQTRAQEISAALTVATKTAAASVTSQFETIRDNAGKEGEKTAVSLQAAYDQANSQLNDLMTKSSERFRQSVGEVRQMAAEVQRQLEETRREMRRGVLELPDEATEAANAMRRVVADQIKALKELAAVVTASGGDFDVADPTPAKPAARPEAPRRAEAPRPALIEDDDALAPEPIRPATANRARPTPPAAASAPAAAPAGERSQTGWLSNLLAAASRDESSPPVERSTQEAPDGISLDIAKYVDTEAAAEMWDRWRGGDASAASRRLYTAAGQQSFDEIRRRYRNDPPFQSAVTRYCQEFERLLAKIGQNDRDGSQSRSTLLSDAGKVYTMLAHASGRLG